VIFDLNVSILFAELPYAERFAAARAAGFEAVETWWPTGEDPELIVEAVRESELQLVSLNLDGGDMSAGDRGLASDLERAREFRDNVLVALDLAARLGCRKLNALLGTEQPGQPRADQMELALENVRWAADRAAAQGAQVLIEPVNRKENGPYLLHTTDQVAEFIAAVNRTNVRMLLDCYHAQRGEGDLSCAIERHLPLIGHVQIAGSPRRDQPGSGEINYRFVLGALGRLGYEGHVGLEYEPRGSTEEALAWLPEAQRSGELDLAAVFAGQRTEAVL
jgi:hydroxypyruvate isomerase